MTRQRVRIALAAGVVAVSLAACAVPIRVSSYTERGADVSRYRTYAFAPAAEVATGDPRLDNNPFFYERVRSAVEKGLAAKGYTRASSAPDVVVHFHASVAQDIDVVDIDRQAGYCADAPDSCKPFAYDAGTLVMDLVDAKNRKLAWRGWAKSNFDGMVDNQDWLEQRVDTAVARIVAQVPAAAR